MEIFGKAILGRMRLYVLLTQAQCPIPILDAAQQVMRGGADVVQLREKDASDREILRMARELRRMTANLGVGFIMNDRADLARLSEADGVHLGQGDLTTAGARAVLLPGQIIGRSTHAISQAVEAATEVVDYMAVGPVYPTATRGYDAGVGTAYVKDAVARIHGPLVAVGGITVERVPEVLDAAGSRPIAIAVCSAILKAKDIEAETRRFKAALTPV